MSRSNAASSGLRHRPSRTVPAMIVAVVLLALGVLTVLAVVARLVNGTWPGSVRGPARTAATYVWGDAPVIATGSVLALLGLILVIAALKPGEYRAARLRIGDADSAVRETDYVISTRALARLAVARADEVDGVDKVTASASGRHVHVRITTTSEQAIQIRERVVSSVTAAVSAAGVDPMPRVTAVVRTKEI